MDGSLARSAADHGAVALRLAELEIRRRTFALQVTVLSGWGLGTVGLAVLLSGLTPTSGLEHPLLNLTTYAAMFMTALSPVGIWAGRALKERDSAARMALVDSREGVELSHLRPALAALVADARLVRSAIEGREFDAEVALRSAWEWMQRLDNLPAADRCLLEDLGLDEVGLTETLRWTIGEVDGDSEGEGETAAKASLAREGSRDGERWERGLALMAEQLRTFEGKLVAGTQGPYR